MKPAKKASEDEKREIAKKAHELEGEIFDLIHPDSEEDLINKQKSLSETMKWYKGILNKYETRKNLKPQKSSTFDDILKYQNWLKGKKSELKEIAKLPEDDQPFTKHWLSNQLEEETPDPEKLERAKDVSIFNIERYDIKDPRNIINQRRSGRQLDNQ